MLDTLEKLPDDPILGLAAKAAADHNPDKVDLTVGVYMDDDGQCPVFEAVKQAQKALVSEEGTKAYLPAAGDKAFNEGVQQLLFGEGSGLLAAGRVSSIQTPGG
ncbi:MAG: aminotransferase class I/II-fold pyridoxal phosphate-dependent enzyme, partial [Pseudomonadota bacterium]